MTTRPGAGRETEEEGAGSLTVIATALTDADDDGVDRALSSTENVTITLDSTLAEAGIYPALDVNGTRTAGEDGLREGTGMDTPPLAARLRHGRLSEFATGIGQRP